MIKSSAHWGGKMGERKGPNVQTVQQQKNTESFDLWRAAIKKERNFLAVKLIRNQYINLPPPRSGGVRSVLLLRCVRFLSRLPIHFSPLVFLSNLNKLLQHRVSKLLWN